MADLHPSLEYREMTGRAITTLVRRSVALYFEPVTVALRWFSQSPGHPVKRRLRRGELLRLSRRFVGRLKSSPISERARRRPLSQKSSVAVHVTAEAAAQALLAYLIDGDEITITSHAFDDQDTDAIAPAIRKHLAQDLKVRIVLIVSAELATSAQRLSDMLMVVAARAITSWGVVSPRIRFVTGYSSMFAVITSRGVLLAVPGAAGRASAAYLSADSSSALYQVYKYECARIWSQAWTPGEDVSSDETSTQQLA
jgi:hypothetical protein